MLADIPISRGEQFRRHPLLWLTLNHFLPAELLRELFAVLVDEVSQGQLKVGDVVEEILTDGPSAFRTWTIRPRLETGGVAAAFLQQLAQVLLWAGDEHAYANPDEPDERLRVWCDDIRHAQVLATRSLTDQMEALEEWPEGLRPLVTAILQLRQDDAVEVADIVAEISGTIGAPLAGLLAKHLGDLCAERDDWERAIAFYGAAAPAAKIDDDAWQSFLGTFQEIYLQSMAAGSWALRTPDNFVVVLEEFYPTTLTSRPLLVANAKHDEMVARMSDRERLDFRGDDRPAVRAAPLLIHSQDTARAWEAWSQRKFPSAYRFFWATLRRQIALGAVDGARGTKLAFARCILDGLQSELGQHHRPETFGDAVRMLIESGRAAAAGEADWSEALVKAYVSHDVISDVIAHLQPERGEGIERVMVAIAVFERWLQLLPPDTPELAQAMSSFIAAAAGAGDRAFNSAHDIAGRGQKALRRMARARPEHRRRVADDVADAVESQLLRRDSLSISDALETLDAYIDALAPERLRTTLSAIVDVLDQLAPGARNWTVIRPAMSLLTSDAAKAAAQDDPTLKRRLTSATVRFALEEGSEHTRLLFLLRDLDPELVAEVDPDRLGAVIEDLRRRAQAVNNSSASECIYALLAAPKLVARAGIEDALAGLRAILKSTTHNRAAIAFAGVTNPLILLGRRAGPIARDLSLTDAEFKDMVTPVFDDALAVWALAQQKPLIFAGFRIPPATAPNPVLVHNFAFGSLALARWLGRSDEMQVALDAAAETPTLAPGIASGRAARVTAGDQDRIEAQTLALESREAFYGALGSRVVRLRSLSPDERAANLRLLLARAFELGPQGVDAGLFAAALDAGLAGEIPSSDAAADYRQRLEHDRDLRLSLTPLYHELLFPASAEQND